MMSQYEDHSHTACVRLSLKSIEILQSLGENRHVLTLFAMVNHFSSGSPIILENPPGHLMLAVHTWNALDLKELQVIDCLST